MLAARLIHLVVLTVFTLPLCAQPALEGDTPPEEKPTLEQQLDQAVTAYFQAESKRDRASLAAKMGRIEGVSVEAVADAVRRAQLWDKVDAGISSFNLPAGTGRAAPIAVRVPEGYDATQAYPLLITLPRAGVAPDSFLPVAAKLLGDQQDAFLMAAFGDYTGIWLSSTPEDTERPEAILAELKHRYHVDTRRIYLLGSGDGGHAAFVWAVLQPDRFAGVVVLAGTLNLQLGAQAAQLLLANLRNMPTLVVYGGEDRLAHVTDEGDRIGGEPAPADNGVAVWNRYLARVAAETSLPIQFIEIPGADDDGITPPADALANILGRKRSAAPAHIDHWFRYPSQGRANYLRMRRFLGEPWLAQRIVVAPAAGETAAQAELAVLREKLGHVAADVEGQTVRLSAHNCETVELRLRADLLDFDREIAIYLNGTSRYEGPLAPRIRTLLEIAYNDWDFQDLWPVRFTIDHAGRARAY